MSERVTLEAILLPDGRIASAGGVPLPASRWRTMGCTGGDSSGICFVSARIDGHRWHARVPAGALNGHEPGLAVTLKRFPRN